jgi:hypothetical protein
MTGMPNFFGTTGKSGARRFEASRPPPFVYPVFT